MSLTRNYRAARLEHVTLLPVTEVTATGAVSASVFEVGDKLQGRLTLTVTGLTATLLVVAVETSHDGVTYSTVANFTNVIANGAVYGRFNGLDRYVRLNVLSLTDGVATIAVAGDIVG